MYNYHNTGENFSKNNEQIPTEQNKEKKEENNSKDNSQKNELKNNEENQKKFVKEKGFYYPLLNKLIENSDKNKENIILLTTGSYNPVHRMHLEILNIASNYLLSLNKFNVLCSFISPSADCYVSYKMPPLIPFEKRCEMIETAIDEFNEENQGNNIKIYLHTWEGSHSYFIDFPYVIEEIQKELNNYKIKLIYVCGLDLFIKCRYSFSKNVIAIDRKPYNNKFKDIPKNLIFIVKDEKTVPYSSTSIKKCYEQKNFEEIKKITFPKVAEEVIEFYDEHY